MPSPRPRRRRLPRLTDRLKLGETGLEVSPICLGLAGSPDTVCEAFDAGINFFFVSADLHWPAYEASRRGLGRLLRRGRGIRERIVVAGVSYVTQPRFCWIPFRELLDAVAGLDRLDVTIAGAAYPAEYPRRLEEFRQQRRIGYLGARALGTSFHDRKLALEAVSARWVDIAFVRYNPSHPGARSDLFPSLGPRPRPLIFNFNNVLGYVDTARWTALGLDDSYWRPQPTDYYRFPLTRPEVDGILCKLSGRKQLQALEAALASGPLDAEEETYLIDLCTLAEGKAVLQP